MIPLHGPQLAVAKGLVQFNEAMKPCKATQDRPVSVESSDKTWSTGKGNGKPRWYSSFENPMNSMKSTTNSSPHSPQLEQTHAATKT